MSYETAAILDAAADHIEKYGHEKGRGHGDGPPRETSACLLGALVIATDNRGSLGAEKALREVLRPHNIVTWNDAPERTQQEVLDALRLAAKQERIAADAEVSA